jgi:protein-tyrosine kinase
MEKIQAAIAKARAQRDGTVQDPEASAPEPVVTTVAPPAAPVVTAPSAAAPMAADPTALWQALPELRLKPRQLHRERILTFEGGPAATPFAVMRTRLLQQARANGWKRIAITSPGPGCGKTFLSLNLAFSLGRQPDQRTLLFEMDFRRPSMARTLGMKDPQDLAAVLEGRALAADNLLRHGSNLAIGTNRGKLPHAGEMLQSRQTRGAIDAIEAAYQPTILLFDMPPMMAGDDTMAFAGSVDAVLIVAAAELTTIRQIDQCERELASQTSIMGVIVNKCRYMEKDTAYGYYD